MTPEYNSPIPRYKKPAAPYRPRKLTPFDTDPNVAMANAQQAQGINHLNSWLTAQQGLSQEAGRVGTERLDRAYGLRRTNLLDSLAARGMIRSGDLGFQQKQLALDANDQRYDLNANVLQNLVSQMTKYLEQKQAIRGATTGAYQTSYADRANGLG